MESKMKIEIISEKKSKNLRSVLPTFDKTRSSDLTNARGLNDLENDEE
jgi:hypothetical protein